MSDNIQFPSEWNELPKHIRKKKIKELKRKKLESEQAIKKVERGSIIFLLFIIVVSTVYYLVTRPKPDRLGEQQQIEGSSHVESTSEVEYQTNPPTSGDHLASATDWGVYDQEIEDGGAVHALEHGGIWITYKDISTEEVEVLNKIANKNKNSVVLSPRSSNDEKISIASWGRLMSLQSIDEEKITTFIKQNINRSPEKLAR